MLPVQRLQLKWGNFLPIKLKNLYQFEHQAKKISLDKVIDHDFGNSHNHEIRKNYK